LKSTPHGIFIGDPNDGNSIDVEKLFHCRFLSWNWRFGDDLGYLDLLGQLASFASLCFSGLAGNSPMGFGFAFWLSTARCK
jgi:hypothetical protein